MGNSLSSKNPTQMYLCFTTSQKKNYGTECKDIYEPWQILKVISGLNFDFINLRTFQGFRTNGNPVSNSVE